MRKRATSDNYDQYQDKLLNITPEQVERAEFVDEYDRMLDDGFEPDEISYSYGDNLTAEVGNWALTVEKTLGGYYKWSVIYWCDEVASGTAYSESDAVTLAVGSLHNAVVDAYSRSASRKASKLAFDTNGWNEVDDDGYLVYRKELDDGYIGEIDPSDGTWTIMDSDYNVVSNGKGSGVQDAIEYADREAEELGVGDSSLNSSATSSDGWDLADPDGLFYANKMDDGKWEVTFLDYDEDGNEGYRSFKSWDKPTDIDQIMDEIARYDPPLSELVDTPEGASSTYVDKGNESSDGSKSSPQKEDKGGTCKGTCSDGTPCNNPVANGEEYCYLHHNASRKRDFIAGYVAAQRKASRKFMRKRGGSFYDKMFGEGEKIHEILYGHDADGKKYKVEIWESSEPGTWGQANFNYSIVDADDWSADYVGYHDYIMKMDRLHELLDEDLAKNGITLD